MNHYYLAGTRFRASLRPQYDIFGSNDEINVIHCHRTHLSGITLVILGFFATMHLVIFSRGCLSFDSNVAPHLLTCRARPLLRITTLMRLEVEMNTLGSVE